jgi:hypothetical protein
MKILDDMPETEVTLVSSVLPGTSRSISFAEWVDVYYGMYFSFTKSQIEGIVQWLRGTDEEQWVDKIDLLQKSLSELDSIEGTVAGSDRMRAALPHLHGMLSQMRGREREAAVSAGLVALAAFG